MKIWCETCGGKGMVGNFYESFECSVCQGNGYTEDTEIEAKAAELDRREKGVGVKHSHVETLVYSSVCYYNKTAVDVYECECGFDGIMDGFIVCPMCKSKLIWDSEVENE